MKPGEPTARLVVNLRRDRAYVGPPSAKTHPISFHRTMPGYAATPVVELPELARSVKTARIAVKNEQERLGLPSFKPLGSSWALHERVKAVAGIPTDAVVAFPELCRIARGLGPPTLCTASDGNHGRAVAALAEAMGCAAVVFLPADSAASRIEAIRGHGASVELIDGSYDEAVAAARAAAHVRGHWYCPDTVGAEASDEERTFARDVMAGYATLFDEFFDQIAGPPDVLFVQAGVGGLSAAGVSSLRRISGRTRIVVVEPEGSNAIALSFASLEPVPVPDTPTVMACLRCQSVSAIAWPILRAGADGAMVVSDDEAGVAVRELARKGVVAGASGAAGLAGALVACADEELRRRLGIDADSEVAVVNTEGATDPASYAAILAG